jgi:hypothetical protein
LNVRGHGVSGEYRRAIDRYRHVGLYPCIGLMMTMKWIWSDVERLQICSVAVVVQQESWTLSMRWKVNQIKVVAWHGGMEFMTQAWSDHGSYVNNCPLW